MLLKHIRHPPDPMLHRGRRHIECTCGWLGKLPVVSRGRRLSPDEVVKQSETLWLSHVPPRERRTYLLLDTRHPPGFRDVDMIRDELRDQAIEDGLPVDEVRLRIAAQAEYNRQRPIVGNFLMPEGTPVQVVEVIDRLGDLYMGRFKAARDGTIEELPVGEIRTPDGRVWRAE